MKINLTPDKFATFIMIYLLDKLNNEDSLRPLNNEEIDKLFDKLSIMKSYLIKFYLNTDMKDRFAYKKLRKAFEEKKYSNTYTINIYDEFITEEIKKKNENIDNDENLKNFYETKDLIKSTINKIRKRKFYNSAPISEEELDNIIKNVLKEKEIF